MDLGVFPEHTRIRTRVLLTTGRIVGGWAHFAGEVPVTETLVHIGGAREARSPNSVAPVRELFELPELGGRKPEKGFFGRHWVELVQA